MVDPLSSKHGFSWWWSARKKEKLPNSLLPSKKLLAAVLGKYTTTYSNNTKDQLATWSKNGETTQKFLSFFLR
ncbi:hypothetical protein PVAP13_4KG069700 [Panicum virgatum]|uniref:Uncharacterized protein n=1 Tax=Panicum virgatum TaxID=38727 RepID=A0A8T0TL71_PANVG|nr:hypothetical protein PVAP13_4KG069700 [Panicum virgatum]